MLCGRGTTWADPCWKKTLSRLEAALSHGPRGLMACATLTSFPSVSPRTLSPSGKAMLLTGFLCSKLFPPPWLCLFYSCLLLPQILPMRDWVRWIKTLFKSQILLRQHKFTNVNSLHPFFPMPRWDQLGETENFIFWEIILQQLTVQG